MRRNVTRIIVLLYLSCLMHEGLWTMAIAMSLPTFKIMVTTVVYCYVVRIFFFLMLITVSMRDWYSLYYNFSFHFIRLKLEHFKHLFTLT